MQPPQLGMGLPGTSALRTKNRLAHELLLYVPDVQFLDTFTGFHLLLKFNNLPFSAGNLPCLSE
jgi:hypothetical protein